MNHEFWDQKYRDRPSMYGEHPNEFLASQSEFLNGLETAFVPGDGEGRNGVWLAQQGLAVSTIDLSGVAVDAALALAESRGVEIDAQQGDLETFEFPENTWDVIVAVWLHLPPDLRAIVHTGLWRGLKPGGVILLEAYRPEHVAFRVEHASVGGPPVADLMFTEERVRQDFPDGVFELIENADVVLDEGKGHQGRSATLRARIRKPVR